jgi:hypothetical protein
MEYIYLRPQYTPLQLCPIGRFLRKRRLAMETLITTIFPDPDCQHEYHKAVSKHADPVSACPEFKQVATGEYPFLNKRRRTEGHIRGCSG